MLQNYEYLASYTSEMRCFLDSIYVGSLHLSCRIATAKYIALNVGMLILFVIFVIDFG